MPDLPIDSSILMVSLPVAFALFCMLSTARAETALAITLTVYLLPLTILPAADTRLLMPFIIFPLLLKSLRERTTLIGGPVAISLALFGLLSVISLIWSENRQATALAAGVTVAMAAGIAILNSEISSTALIRTIQIFAAVVIGLSVIYAFFPVGILSERVRGIFANPNGLAAFVVVVLPLLMRGWWRVCAVGALTLVILSGSRAGTAACFAELAVILGSGQVSRLGRRLPILGSITGAILVGMANLDDPVQSTSSTDGNRSVLRFGNSRAEAWEIALEKWQESPLLGAGSDATELLIANSFLKLIIDLGFVGIFGAAPLVVYLANRAISGDTRIAALATGAIVNCVFESWLFTAGSIYFLLLWLQMANAWKVQMFPFRDTQITGDGSPADLDHGGVTRR